MRNTAAPIIGMFHTDKQSLKQRLLFFCAPCVFIKRVFGFRRCGGSPLAGSAKDEKDGVARIFFKNFQINVKIGGKTVYKSKSS